MPPVIVDLPWPPDTGEDLVWPDGTPVRALLKRELEQDVRMESVKATKTLR